MYLGYSQAPGKGEIVPFTQVIAAAEKDIFDRDRNGSGRSIGEQAAVNVVKGLFLVLREKAEAGEIGTEEAIESGEMLLSILSRARNDRLDSFVEGRSRDKELAWLVYQKTDGRCTYCNVLLNPFDRSGGNGFHVDHAVSRINGGSNEIDNLVPACATCNIGKSGMNADEFRAKRGAS